MTPRAPGLAVALVLALAVAACGGTAWPKTAGETTCGEWSTQMTATQRDALGTAMLLALRQSDGGTLRPPENLIAAYVGAIGDVCASTPDEKVSSVGATLYTLSDDLKP